MWIWQIFDDFVGFMADFAQLCKETIYGDLLEYFGIKSRRYQKSAEEENFVSISTEFRLR